MMTTMPALTRNQSLVMEVLSRAQQPLSAYVILDRLRDHGLRAPLQIYRALDKLTEFGLVHRLESLNAFIACAHADEDCCAHGHGQGRVAFAICDSCGRTIEFHDDVIDHRIDELAREKKFRPVRTNIEIRGLCADCAA